MIRTKIVLVTGIESPFWEELACRVLEFTSMQLHILFTDASLEDRGPHWRTGPQSSQSTVIPRGEALEPWLSTQLSLHAPDIVVCGGIKPIASRIAFKLARKAGLLVGIFGEQPFPRRAGLAALRDVQYRILLRRFTPDFMLAVGERAVDIYKRLLPRNVRVFFFPYHQDLQFKSRECAERNAQVRFLFSGRLVARNSIQEMVAAFQRLADSYPGQFTWCISAHGPEEYRIREACSESVAMNEAVFFDRDFDGWTDRLRPFFRSDVLVVPAKHSGWGLVVPEGLAAGIPVIASRQVEAARYFVHDFVNGMLVEPTENDLYQALSYLIENREELDRMKSHCRQAAEYGDAKMGAQRLQGIITFLQHARRGHRATQP